MSLRFTDVLLPFRLTQSFIEQLRMACPLFLWITALVETQTCVMTLPARRGATHAAARRTQHDYTRSLKHHQRFELYEQPDMHGEPFNFGPPAQQNHSVLELVEQMSLYWKQVRWQDISQSVKGPYESGLLKLNCDKALHYLNWHAVMGFEDTVRMTAEWYKSYYQQPENIAATTQSQIEIYMSLAKQQRLKWAE